MNIIRVKSVDEILDVLSKHNVIYTQDGNTKYWLYRNYILSSSVDDPMTTTIINDSIDLSQDFYYVVM